MHFVDMMEHDVIASACDEVSECLCVNVSVAGECFCDYRCTAAFLFLLLFFIGVVVSFF